MRSSRHISKLRSVTMSFVNRAVNNAEGGGEEGDFAAKADSISVMLLPRTRNSSLDRVFLKVRIRSQSSRALVIQTAYESDGARVESDILSALELSSNTTATIHSVSTIEAKGEDVVSTPPPVFVPPPSPPPPSPPPPSPPPPAPEPSPPPIRPPEEMPSTQTHAIVLLFRLDSGSVEALGDNEAERIAVVVESIVDVPLQDINVAFMTSPSRSARTLQSNGMTMVRSSSLPAREQERVSRECTNAMKTCTACFVSVYCYCHAHHITRWSESMRQQQRWRLESPRSCPTNSWCWNLC